MSEKSGVELNLFQRRVKERVDALGGQAVALAASAGLERNYIQDIVDGRKASVRAAMLGQLSAALRCPPEYLTDPAARLPAPEDLVPNRLRGWREKAGLTQEEAAAALGEELVTVVALESAPLPPGPVWLARLARLYGATPGYLLDVDPESADRRLQTVTHLFERLDDRDRDELARTAELLARRRTGTAG